MSDQADDFLNDLDGNKAPVANTPAVKNQAAKNNASDADAFLNDLDSSGVSTPAKPINPPIPQNQPDQSPSLSDYDPAIKASFGLTGALYGGYGSLTNKDFFPSLPRIDTSKFAPQESEKPSGGLPSPQSVDPVEDNYDQVLQNEIDSLTPKVKPDGRKGVEDFNGETQRRAMVTRNNLANPGMANTMADAGPMVLRNGILVPQYDSYQMDQQQAAQIRSQAEQNIAAKQAQAMKSQQQAEQAAQTAQNEARAAKIRGVTSGAGKVLSTASGGANAMSGLYDTYANARDNGWSDPRTITKGMSTVGGLAQMTHLPYATQIGAALQLPESVMNTASSVKAPEESTAAKITKGLSTAGIAGMMIPGGQLPGALAQIPEGVRQIWNMPSYLAPGEKRPHAH